MSKSVLDLANDAAEYDDQRVTPESGGFDFKPPVEGVTILRFVEYIEIGSQPQKPYEGKPKPDNLEVFLGFELLHPKHMQEYEKDGETVKVPHFVRIKMPVKTGDKARFKKLFKKMAYGRDIKHMAQMLGEAFIADVFHYKPDEKRVYANLDKDGEWSLRAPFAIDPLTEARTDVPVPPATRPLRIFIWKRPNPETWASLYIDGTRTVKTEGKPDQEVSKNWMQALILKAKDFHGSALEAMINDLGGLSVDTPAGELQKEPDTTASTASQSTTTSTTTASPSEEALGELKKTETPTTATDGDLALLGLSAQ